jgi:anti-sigma factor RsiW
MKLPVPDEHLTAYVDGRLSPRGLRRVRAHLDRSPDADALVRHLVHLVARLRRLRHHRHPEPPPEFWPLCYARLRDFAHSYECAPKRHEQAADLLKCAGFVLLCAGALHLLTSRHASGLWLLLAGVACYVVARLLHRGP